MNAGELDRVVRCAIYQHFIETGRAPGLEELAQRAGTAEGSAEACLHRLAAQHRIALAPGTANIWMAHPFSAVPTGYPVVTRRARYWANCAWDALGIPALLGIDGSTRAICPDCGDGLEIIVRGGSASSNAECVHFGVGPGRFWENVGFT